MGLKLNNLLNYNPWFALPQSYPPVKEDTLQSYGNHGVVVAAQGG
jgi:hypothetical protein